MLGFIKKTILASKQGKIKNKKYPNVSITLHADMPSPSLNKMAEVAEIVNKVNSLEPRISGLTDQELKAKTLEFKRADQP